MVKSLSKVVYKPNPQSTEEYMMFVNFREYKRWKEGETYAYHELCSLEILTRDPSSVPLTDVVDSFKVFVSQQGNQGRLGEASKQQLENTFGTSKDIEVAIIVLKSGTMHASDRLDSDRNLFTGDFTLDGIVY